MADKEEQSPYPMLSTGGPRIGAAAHDAGDLRRKKRNKYILYGVLFAIFQTGVILVFALTIMKVRTPKLRVRSVALSSLTAATTFNATMSTELTLRNKNFGRYNCQNTTVEVFHGSTSAGRAVLRASRVGWRSTKKIDLSMDLNLGESAELATDLRSGILPLTVQSKMRGKVELLFIMMKKKKSTDMNCLMELVLDTRQIRNISCKE